MIIGLSGYAQSGKDTVAEYLVNNHGYTRVAFADAVRDFAYDINPLVDFSEYDGLTNLQDLVDTQGWDKAKQHPTVRKILQNVGLSARARFGESFWINIALNKVSFTGNFVITDVRFKNEASVIKRRDYAQVWRIERPGVGPVNNHISELDMDDWDFDCRFINDGSLEDLIYAVKIRLQNV